MEIDGAPATLPAWLQMASADDAAMAAAERELSLEQQLSAQVGWCLCSGCGGQQLRAFFSEAHQPMGMSTLAAVCGGGDCSLLVRQSTAESKVRALAACPALQVTLAQAAEQRTLELEAQLAQQALQLSDLSALEAQMVEQVRAVAWGAGPYRRPCWASRV